MKRSNVLQIAINSLFASLSVVLGLVAHYLNVFGFRFDFSDIPVFISTLLFGAPSGCLILFVSSFIKTLFFSVAGVPGFFLRMSYIVSIFFLGIYYKKKRFLTLLSIASIITCLIVKLPMSYIFWTRFGSMSYEQIRALIFPVIIPHNLIRISINILASIFLSKKLKYFLSNSRIIK